MLLNGPKINCKFMNCCIFWFRELGILFHSIHPRPNNFILTHSRRLSAGYPFNFTLHCYFSYFICVCMFYLLKLPEKKLINEEKNTQKISRIFVPSNFIFTLFQHSFFIISNISRKVSRNVNLECNLDI